jgi:thiosulfate/3-mercaptopyruvate sulfurtransferase
MGDTLMRRIWAAGAAIALCLALGGLPVAGQEAPSGGSVEIPAKYVHPEVLASADWVAAHLDDPTVRIVDARADGPPYSAGHIPGAVSVDIFDELCCPSDIMDAEPFAQLMGEKGVGDDTTVVVYDTEGGTWGARLWWALQYYGHEDAKLLDGGLDAWEAEGLPLESDAPVIEPAVFTAEVRPEWYVAMDDVRAAIDDPAISIVDALPSGSYVYEHIPTAVSLPAPDLLDVTGVVKGAEGLSAMLEDAGLDPAQRTITYCGGGYYGAFAALVLHLMGFEDVAMYDGALEEWTSDPTNPVESVS